MFETMISSNAAYRLIKHDNTPKDIQALYNTVSNSGRMAEHRQPTGKAYSPFT